ncbi:MAG: D-aminoacyl-tRNA deacylase [Terriglobales bacterium]
MRALLQRVGRAQVRVDGVLSGAIGPGCVAFIGVARGDTSQDVDYIARKICGLRLWPDAEGKMNLPLGAREILAISQFTLLADTRRGLRPSFDDAAPAALALPVYQALLDRLRALGARVATGVFQADMEVELVNQGPVTVALDSRERGK